MRCRNMVADYCILIIASCEWAGMKFRWRIKGTDLSDAWVGALNILAGQVQPAGGVGVHGRAVVP